jgi:hypothetical protein
MLIQVDLHVCRILSYDAPENDLGLKTLYEVWGWSEDSRGSLYVVVTPGLPAGVRPGLVVQERATVYGYFCKLQGYVAVASAPQAGLTAAPLLIGNMVRYQAPLTVLAKPDEAWRLGVGLLLAVSFVGLISRRPLFRRKQHQRIEDLGPSDDTSLETWLDQQGWGAPARNG